MQSSCYNSHQIILTSITSIHRYFTFLTKCKTPKACMILLHGHSKDVVNEIDHNLADAMSIACNVVFNLMLVQGGGVTEMVVSMGLHVKMRMVVGMEGWLYRAVADAIKNILLFYSLHSWTH